MGCASHTLLSLKTQQTIQSKYQKQVFYLKHSFFVGPFFAYDDRFYISERAFDERVLIESLGGDPILAREPTGILPLGTQVTVQSIEFPTSSAMAERKLKSPRHFTWVTLHSSDGDPGKPYVLVLTREFKKTSDFKEVLEKFLATRNPSKDFANRSPEVIEAMNHKSVVKGMRADALLKSRGYPDKISRKFIEGVKIERWQYAQNRVVVLQADQVKSWQGFPSERLRLLSKPTPVPSSKPQP